MENTDRLCMNCFAPLTAGSVCPGCGFDNDQENDTSFLPLRTVLQDRYVLGHVQAWESDAAVYAAYDRTLQAPCVVREFLPRALPIGWRATGMCMCGSVFVRILTAISGLLPLCGRP